jgi:hypothetical protein
MLILPEDNECFEVTPISSTSKNLKSNQEKADTKVVSHPLQVLQPTKLFVMLRSPSGDTDIFLLALLISELSHLKGCTTTMETGITGKGHG